MQGAATAKNSFSIVMRTKHLVSKVDKAIDDIRRHKQAAKELHTSIIGIARNP